MKIKLSIFVFVFILASCVSEPTQDTKQAITEEIAETKDEIPAIPADQTEELKDDTPTSSPKQGGKIIFEAGDEGLLGDLYVMNEDGSEITKLLDSGDYGYQHFGYPDWSPDGSQIVFSGLKPPWEILIANADGSGLRTIEGTTNGQYPDWSPDGQKIAFSAWDEGSDIYTINIDGTDLQKIVSSEADEFDPSWSPDGSKIVFYSCHSGDDCELYVINANRTNLVQLTDNDMDDWMPSWSPTGNEILYLYGLGGEDYTELRGYNLDNSHESQYTTEFAFPDFSAGTGACWAPNGENIAFVSNGKIVTIHWSGGVIFKEVYSGKEFTGYPSWK